MREWNLTHADGLAPLIAADARDGRTVYHDDQIWRLRLGAPDEPAIACETRYGGRLGLARLVPLWRIGQRQVYETQGYHAPPVIKTVTPNYVRLTAGLTYAVTAALELWAMESQALGGRMTLHNNSDQPQTVRLDLVAQGMRENATMRMSLLTLDDGSHALQLGHLPHLQPVLLLEGAHDNDPAHPRLGRTLTLDPGQQTALRWVIAGLPARDDSLLRAHGWLHRNDWDAAIRAILDRAEAAAQVRTGDADWDLALAWSQNLVVQSFLAPTGQLPHPTFVTARRIGQGFPAGETHASGFASPWGGQSAPDALILAPAAALASPELAGGVVRNFLAVQRDDGWIDARPGAGGQRANLLAPPLLATLAYSVYQLTGDRALLADTFDGLLTFFRRWFQPDVDADQDGLPEWQHLDQGAFADGPTFAQQARWGQGIDIATIEAPDMVAYLIREARSLRRIAAVLERDADADPVAERLARLEAALDELWDADQQSFHYRDRATHSSPAGEVIYHAKGDQPLTDATSLPHPSRLILRASGGLTRKPNLSCIIEGIDADGQTTREEVPGDAFNWYRSAGSATTRHVWRTIHRLTFNGLSRVYSVEVITIDLTQPDQSLLVPLWAGTLDDAQTDALLNTLTDPEQYWRSYGVSACPANTPLYDPNGVNGCGGVYPFWNLVFGWALMDAGHADRARQLFTRLLHAQIAALKSGGVFHSRYNADTGEGIGAAGMVTGAVSWAWFARLFGAIALGPDRVAINGPLALEQSPVTWTQHGVQIERRHEGTTITFPGGRTVTLDADAPPQVVHAPSPPPDTAPAAPNVPPDVPPDDPAPPDRPDEGLLPAVD